MCGGIHFFNSEIGLNKLTLQSLVYCRAEKSGIIMRDWVGFSEKHIGNKDEFEQKFIEALENIMSNIGGAIRNLTDLKQVKVSDVPEIINVILDDNQVKEDQRVAVDRAQSSLTAQNLFEIVMIFIRAATDPDLSLEDREEIQKIGGQIVVRSKRYKKWL